MHPKLFFDSACIYNFYLYLFIYIIIDFYTFILFSVRNAKNAATILTATNTRPSMT